MRCFFAVAAQGGRQGRRRNSNVPLTPTAPTLDWNSTAAYSPLGAATARKLRSGSGAAR
jgi:uncharacterized protein (DUF849 family)